MWQPSRWRRLSLLALMLVVTACTVRRPVAPGVLAPERRVEATFSPPRAVEFQTDAAGPHRYEVRRLSGVVRAVRGDTVWVEVAEARGARGERILGGGIVGIRSPTVAILRPDARSSITTRKFSAGRTALAVLGLGVVAGAVFLISVIIVMSDPDY